MSLLRRSTFLVAAAALVISACGGSSSSENSSAPRVKNGAITTVPVTGCVATSTCKPGDLGPAGGVILSITDDAGCGTYCLYTEVAPADWANTLTVNCDGTTPRTTVAGAVTEPRCNLDQDKVMAGAYTGGATCNWVIPTYAQMKLFKIVKVPGIQDFYWTNEKVYFNNDRGGDFSYGIKMADLTQTNPRTAAEAYVRPVRSYSAEYLKTQTPCTSGNKPPVGTSTTVKAVTTTTLALFAPTTGCVSSNSCKPGDVGPAGGVIISVDNNSQCGNSCWYTEVAPASWAQKMSIGCMGGSSPTSDPSCNLAQDKGLARSYTGGYTCNWEMPTFAQMSKAKSLGAKGLQGTYWVNAKITQQNRGADASFGFRISDSGQENMRVTQKAGIRPIRSFSLQTLKETRACGDDLSELIASMTTTTTSTTTTTLKPTTTTVAPVVSTCASPTSCKVGDIGPGLGIVFYVSASPFTLVGAGAGTCGTNCHFLEAAPGSWFGSGFDPIFTASGANKTGPAVGSYATAIGSGFANTGAVINKVGTKDLAAGLARAYTGGGKNDWFLPAKEELVQLYKNQQLVGLNTRISKAVEYWSSTGVNDNAAYPTQFIAIDLTDGSTFAVPGDNTARYVRPVRAG